MYLKLLFAALLALLPVPALADVTARYTAGPKDRLVIEADDGGNSRIGFGEKFAIIRRDGVDYVVATDAAGNPKVGRLADVLAVVQGQLKSGAAPAAAGANAPVFQISAGAEENVAGYAGMVWLVAPTPVPGKPAPPPVDVVISADPSLAPVGAAFRHLLDLASPLLGMALGESGNLGSLLTELFAKGTPLKIGPLLKLETVSNAEIAAARFELPDAVLEPIEFLQAISPSESGAGLQPLP